MFIYPEEVDVFVPQLTPNLITPVKLNPYGASFGSKVKLNFNCPNGTSEADKSRAGVYRLDRGSTSWTYIDSIKDESGEKISANILWLDTYCLLVDKSPPVLFDVRPANNTHYKGKIPTFSGKAKDFGSKIDDMSLVLTVDNTPVPEAEFEPDCGCYRQKPDQPLTKGKHIMNVKIKDNAGNWSKEFINTFYVE